MHNLKLLFCESLTTSLNDGQQILLDTSKEVAVYYYATKSTLHALDTGCGVIKKLFEAGSIVNAEFLYLNNQVCVASEEGEVVAISLDTNEVNECTFCDVGIENMCWSPDQEVVVFVTKNQHVVLMTCDFEIIADHSLYEQVENTFVNVGWGSRETQFNGKQAKSADIEKLPAEDINDLSTTTHLTWRGDSVYFAVSYLSTQKSRVFKVFDKEGQLCFTSEAEKYLRPVFAWRPSGNWIAMPQCLPNKSIIALFEKNGLKHREITLPFSLKEEEVQKISWSSDSDILALQTYRIHSDEQRLYLYTIGNYHWYLKQMLIFNATEDGLVTHTWSDNCGHVKTLHILLKSGKHHIYSWETVVNKSQSLVGVIDGKKLLLTDFTHNIVPPPMCQKEIELTTNSAINSIGFNGKTIFLFDAHKQLYVYNIDVENPLSFSHKLSCGPMESILEIYPLRNMHWLTDQTIIAVSVQGRLVFINIDLQNKCYTCKSHSIGGKIMQICKTFGEVYANLADGSVYHIKMNVDNKIEALRKENMNALKEYAQDIILSPTKELIIWQTNLCLQMDNEHIANDVTSFCVVGDFLIYTLLCTLHFVRIHDKSLASKRKIEAGAKLITTLSKEGRLVIQMPRGNLETITPRILVLQYIGKLLDARQYKEAFTLSRKHRINLNILCDHNVCDFIQNIDIFLNEITNTQWLNLFLTDLQNEDFTTTMYADNYEAGDRVYPQDFELATKINYLCKIICSRMIERNEEYYSLSILTAYVKMGEIETALTIIWKKIQQDGEITKIESKTIEAEKSLRYLFYLVDVNDLYNVALGTYDFRLVLFVAQHSQKDPREFLLTLNNLNSMDNDYRCFCIDKYLKRNERALKHIIRCGQARFAEALDFIKENELFSSALQEYADLQTSTDQYEQVALAYADFLRANGKLYEASLMYERGGNLKQAQLCARHVLDWERVLYLAKKLQEDVADVALSLVVALQEKGEYEVCYQLTMTYSGNVAEAIKFLMMGKLYLKAINAARLQDEFKFIEEVITPDLLSYINILNATLKDEHELYSSYKSRVLALRQHQKTMAIEENQTPVQIDEIDLLSDTTSLHSSRYTASTSSKSSRSSKNRRKHARKLLSLKPGNPFEEMALIDALHGLVIKITDVKQQQHIRDICKALLELLLDNEAKALQQCYKNLLHLVQGSLEEIWIPELTSFTQPKSIELETNYLQLKNEQRYSMIEPIKRLKPSVNLIDWEQSVLN